MSANELTKRTNLLNALPIILQQWLGTKVTDSTKRNCFKRGDFVKGIEEGGEEDGEMNLDFEKLVKN